MHSVNNIDPRIQLLLQKETSTAQSLANIKGTTLSLSWDQVINSLIRSGIMDASGNSSSPSTARVPLSVILNYHSFVLDINVSINFVYNVNINGYVLPTTAPVQATYNCTHNP